MSGHAKPEGPVSARTHGPAKASDWTSVPVPLLAWVALAPGAVALLLLCSKGFIIPAGLLVSGLVLVAFGLMAAVQKIAAEPRDEAGCGVTSGPQQPASVPRVAAGMAVSCLVAAGMTVAVCDVIAGLTAYGLWLSPTATAGYSVGGWAERLFWGVALPPLAVVLISAGGAMSVRRRRGTSHLRRTMQQCILVSFLAAAMGMSNWAAFPVYLRERVGQSKATCISNVKQLVVAMQMYMSDNDGTLPPASDWCDRLAEYAGGPKAFRCPEAPKARCAYAYSRGLGSLRYDALASPANTVSVFESDEGWNATGGRRLLAGVPRHLGGDNYGFADGHALWIGRQQERAMSEEGALRWGP